MSTRIRRFVPEGDDTVIIPDNTTVASEMPVHANQAILEHHNGTTEVLTLDQAKRRILQEGDLVIANTTSVVVGRSQESIMTEDLQYYYTWLKKNFRNCQQHTFEFYGKKGFVESIFFNTFPLPSTGMYGNRYTTTGEKIVIITAGYPELSPWGIYAHQSSPHWNMIQNSLGGTGHVMRVMDYDPSAKNPEELAERGFQWICFHYNNDNGAWKFDRNNIQRGDSLSKYLINVYSALNGAFARGQYV